MRRLHIATEEEMAAIDQAIEADRLAKSTNPSDVSEVANFKEELQRLKDQGTPESDEPATTTAGDASGSDTPDDDTSGGSGDDSTEPETDPTEDSSSKEDETPESEDKDNKDDKDAGTNAETDAAGTDDDSSDTEEPSDAGDKLAEEAISTGAALTRIYGVLHRANLRGGVQSASSAMAIENIIAITASKVGIEPPKPKQLGSYAAFESISTRETATAAAMEGISDMLSSIWEAIKKFFIRIFNWVREFFTGKKQQAKAARNEIEKAEKLAKEIQDKAEKADSDALAKRRREDKLRNITRKVYHAKAAQLTTGDTDMTFEQAYQASRKLADVAALYTDYSAKAIKRIVAAAKAMTGVEVKLDNTYGEFVITDAEAGKLNASKARHDGAISVSKYNREIISELLPGNCTLNAVVLNSSKIASFEKETADVQASTVKQHYFRYERRNGAVVPKAGVYFNASAAEFAELMAYAREDLVRIEDELSGKGMERFDEVNRVLTKTINSQAADVKRVISGGKTIDNVTTAHRQFLALVLSNYLSYFNATVVRGHASVAKGLSTHINALVDYTTAGLRLLESTVVNPGQD